MEYHILIVRGHAAVWDGDDDSGEVWAACLCCGDDRQGCALPTQEDKSRSVDWLSARGYGLPVQAIVMDGLIRGQATANPLDLGIIEPSTMIQMRRLLLGETTTAQTVPELALQVIDAEIVETPETTPEIQQDPPLGSSKDHDPNTEKQGGSTGE